MAFLESLDNFTVKTFALSFFFFPFSFNKLIYFVCENMATSKLKKIENSPPR